MSTTIADFPFHDVHVAPQPQGLFFTKAITDWLDAYATQVQHAPTVKTLPNVSLTAQTATIALTPFALGSVSAGILRISAHLHITQAATTSSSVTVTITYTHHGQTCTQSITNATNTTTTPSSYVFVLSVDANSAVSYSTTYVSVGATVAQYGVDFCGEGV